MSQLVNESSISGFGRKDAIPLDKRPPRRAALVDLLDCQPLHTSKATAAATIKTATKIQYWTLNAKDR
jgi:hypothetical protein